MIAVTKLAEEKLIDYLGDNNMSSPIRIALRQGGCSGAALGLAIDEYEEGLLNRIDDNTLRQVCKGLVEQK